MRAVRVQKLLPWVAILITRVPGGSSVDHMVDLLVFMVIRSAENTFFFFF